MSLTLWGVLLIVVGVCIYIYLVGSAWMDEAEAELHRMRETVTFVEPADPQVRIHYISGGIYDHEQEGDFD